MGAGQLRQKIQSWMPGLGELVHYQKENWRFDVGAGLSVAAVALPVGIAYAQLAGFSPVVGLYSTILPMIVYALLGSSRQLIVGPDAATCAMISATLIPLANGNLEHYLGMAITLTLLSALFFLLAGRLRLGFLADFLSRPILTGLLNGVGLTIMFNQIGKVTGISTTGNSTIAQAHSLLTNVLTVHWQTLAFSALLLTAYIVIRKFFKKLPAALIVMLLGVVAAFAFSLPDIAQIKVIGTLEAGLPSFHVPILPLDALGVLVPAAAGLTLISYNSAMLTGRSFAAKNGYIIDANHEFFALGMANIASGLSQGFTISGADSRTAVNDAAGGKTRMVSIVAALAVLIVLLFLTAPLAWVPNAALGVILIASSFGLLDFKGMWRLRRLNHQEFWICVATLLGVLIIGVMPGIVMAVTLSIIRFLTQVARPVDQQLGCIEGRDGFYELSDYPDAKPLPGLLLYRFESPLTFFNADYFRQRVKTLIQQAQHPVHWVVIDTISMGDIDVTGIFTLIEMGKTLEKQNMKLILTGRTRRIVNMLDGWTTREDIQIRFFPTRRGALAAFYEDEAQRAAKEQETTDTSDTAYTNQANGLRSISNFLPNHAGNEDASKNQ